MSRRSNPIELDAEPPPRPAEVLLADKPAVREAVQLQLRRGQRLAERSRRKPAGSNGQRRDLVDAAACVQQALMLARKHGVRRNEEPALVRALALRQGRYSRS
jgi:hypothetical protein